MGRGVEGAVGGSSYQVTYHQDVCSLLYSQGNKSNQLHLRREFDNHPNCDAEKLFTLHILVQKGVYDFSHLDIFCQIFKFRIFIQNVNLG